MCDKTKPEQLHRALGLNCNKVLKEACKVRRPPETHTTPQREQVRRYGPLPREQLAIVRLFCSIPGQGDGRTS
jgi:hypothetical protein